jgi:LysR family transcriptional regulator, regulator for bpeEF and oprC
MNSLQGIDEFVQTVQSKSFVAAAQVLGLTPSGVSKAVARLEARIGARLLHRTTRSLSLTSEGERFLQHCQHMLTELQEARDELRSDHSQVVGRVRLELPSALGTMVIAPQLHQLAQKHPGLLLDVTFSERVTDLAAEGIDVAVRLGALADSSLHAQSAGSFNLVTCAAPSYLAQRGTISKPQDLQAHNCLGFFFPQTGRTLAWSYAMGKGAKATTWRFTPESTLRFNHGEALLMAAIAGAGVAYLPSFLVQAAIVQGLLVAVLPDWISQGAPIWVVSQQRLSASLKAKAVASAMCQILTQVR